MASSKQFISRAHTVRIGPRERNARRKQPAGKTAFHPPSFPPINHSEPARFPNGCRLPRTPPVDLARANAGGPIGCRGAKQVTGRTGEGTNSNCSGLRLLVGQLPLSGPCRSRSAMARIDGFHPLRVTGRDLPRRRGTRGLLCRTACGPSKLTFGLYGLAPDN
jgi:hypothetical protein